MKIANINLIKFFLILLILGLQTPAFSEEVEPEFDLKQFLSTLSGVYASIDKPSVILSIHVNANDNSIVVIDVSGTLEFLRDIGYISEEEYKQNLTVSPMERGFIGKLQNEEQIYIGGQKNYIPHAIYAELNPIVPEQERSSKNSIGLQSLISLLLEKSFMEMFFVVDITNPIQITGFSRSTSIYNDFGYLNGFVKVF
jgi:hypothetical protein